MEQEVTGLIPKIADALLAMGSGGLIALLAIIVAGLVWWENRGLRKRIDDLQDKRLEENKILIQLVERFTASMQDALSALYKRGA